MPALSLASWTLSITACHASVNRRHTNRYTARSTQPSTLCGTEKWVSAFEL